MAGSEPRLSKKQILKAAQERERVVVESFIKTIAHEKHKLDGMTRLLGCIVRIFGEIDIPMKHIAEMHPGRMYIAERDGVWQVRIREDATKPVELSLVPELMPEEALDREAMERDGVTEVKVADVTAEGRPYNFPEIEA